MPDMRPGTGPNCHFSEQMVTLLMSKLTPLEREVLNCAHPDVIIDSIRECWRRTLQTMLEKQ